MIRNMQQFTSKYRTVFVQILEPNHETEMLHLFCSRDLPVMEPLCCFYVTFIDYHHASTCCFNDAH